MLNRLTSTLLLLLLAPAVVSYGTPHDSVMVMTTQNFSTMLEDPANGLFLIKFFAPWCGHCKKLAPILEEVAPLVKGKMAIGTVDCTTQKPLCAEYNVKSYPTIKFYRDGKFFDYPGGRTKEKIIGFARKMSLPAVQVVENYEAALKIASDNEPGVAFLLYDKSLTGGNVQEELQSTLLAQVFTQVARKQQALANFVLLKPAADTDSAPLIPGIVSLPDSFVAKIEPGVAPVFWDMKELTSFKFIEFMTENNLKLVTEMGPNNFFKIGKLGKSLVIGCVDGSDKEQVKAMEAQLAEYATNGPKAITSQYYFGYMDGQLWQKFLQQFSIHTLPQIFVLNVPTKSYYQHETYSQNVKSLLEAIDNGLIPRRDPNTNRGWRGLADKVQLMFFTHLPYSLVALIALVAVITILIVPPAEELRPPYRSEQDEFETEPETFEEEEDEPEAETKKEK
ncbi:intramolecular oxidoreductase [Fragilaria crotonensis]|nr:intramolecular oxidoreductase [Fragilaria crotonensis]